MLGRWPQVGRVRITLKLLWNNIFVSTKRNSMKCFVTWILLNMHVLSFFLSLMANIPLNHRTNFLSFCPFFPWVFCRHTANAPITAGLTYRFLFWCFATTQLALQVQQERTHVVCIKCTQDQVVCVRETRKRPARGHSRNGPWT